MDSHDLTRLEDRVRGMRHVLDCALLPHGPAVLAYVVPDHRADLARLRRQVTAAALRQGVAAHAVLVDDVPRHPDGTVRQDALETVPAVDEALLARYRETCREAGVPVEVSLAAARRKLQRGVPAEPPAPADDVAGPSGAGGAAGTGPAGADEVAARPAALSTGPDLHLPATGPSTLPEALVRVAEERPHAGLHLAVEAHRTVFLSYPELLDRARRILGGLRAAGLRPGDRAILQLPTLDTYFPALWACLLGGVVPVTVARPPGYDTRGAVLEKLYHAWETLREPVVICSGLAVEGVRAMPALYPMDGVRVLDADELVRAAPEADVHRPDPGETAVLQLSSGSTGRSKAIAITHRGVMEYVAGARTQGIAPTHTTVNWLPLDHVAGLLMFHLRDTVLGCVAVHTPTELVLADPLLWLDLLERYSAAHSWSPNFGFKLVVEALKRHPERRWDLSSVRSLINAGEQCTLPVMRDFVDATAPFGLARDSVLLAWGMAETCTVICYKRFGTAGDVVRVRKSSLTSDLVWAGEDVPAHEVTTFLSMGPPTLGAGFRICDDEDRVLPEGRIGRLQVRSGRVTPGYVDNPEADAEAFRGDGWFDTGDLGFLKDGELTLTGRRKEVIIVNGSHYFCHELEDVVGAVDGVLAGSVAACGVPDPASGSEQLVVFFVPEAAGGDDALADCARRVTAELARRFQLAGTRAVPVPAAEFPRTTSGKIQRTDIRRRFLAGGFDDLLRSLNLVGDDAREVPDAVHRSIWERLPAAELRTAPPDPATTLVVADRHGLADELTAPTGALAAAVVAAPGTGFARTAPGRYTLDFADAGQWRELWRELRAEDRLPTTLLHLAGYGSPEALEPDAGDAPPALTAAGLALVLAAQVHLRHADARSCRVLTVSRGLHRITGDEVVGVPGALTAGVTTGLALEAPEAEVRHLDLAGATPAQDARELTGALTALPPASAGGGAVETAVRDGALYRRRLEKVRVDAAPAEPSPQPLLTDDACLVVTGGLGGVGTEVLSSLLSRYRLRLLVLGRTPVPEDEGPGPAARALARLRALGDVRYRRADVTDRAALAAAVAAAEESWGRPLDGVLHLAGAYDSVLLRDEEPERWRAASAAKTLGALHLAEIVRGRPGARFVSFSSLLTVTPAAESGSYIAANRFLEALSDHLRAVGVPAHCLAWGLWRGTGMNRGSDWEEAAARRGLLALSAAEGRSLTRAVLAQPPGTYVVGLDETSPALRGLVRPQPPAALEEPRARGTTAALPPLFDLRGREVPLTAEAPAAEPAPPAPGAPPAPARPAAAATGAPNGHLTRLRERVRGILADAAGHDIDERQPFHDAGLGSIQLMRAHGELERALGRELPRTLLFQYPTVAELIDHLLAEQQGPAAEAAGSSAQQADDRRIAVVGMAGRFPGAPDLDAYWRLITSGGTALRRFTPAELAASGLTEEQLSRGDHVPVGGPLDGADLFDAGFFGISAREAALMEPQQRLLLEVCHEALEHGGYADAPEGTRVGVFAGTGMTLHALQTYLLNNLVPTQDITDPVTALQVAVGNQADFAAGRVAHRLGLHGPAVGVQTACSSSLVGVHLAAQSLLSGDAELALAGAAAVHVPQHTGYRHVPGSILSRTGACRAFDANADGTVGGNGVAAVLLKRLDRALADGDTVHAVILGSAVNNDGDAKVGFTAPGVAGQRQVIARALQVAGVSAETVGYVEAHGTGTELGDPIEFQALSEAFRESTDRKTYCALGSVKPSIGHLDTAAGMAGLIKAVLALRHGWIPPLAGLDRPHPALPLDDSPFYLPTSGRPWRQGETPRRAAVSALGVGGTNAHLVLEEPAPREADAAAPADGPGLLPVSARGEQALRRLAAAYRDRLREDPPPRAADVFATAALRRPHHPHRLTVFGHGTGELAQALDDFLASPADAPAPARAPWVSGRVPTRGPGPVAVVFAGQGTQRRGMARELYHRFPVFRETVDTCEQLYREAWEGSLTELLLAPDCDEREDHWTTDRTQPALFALEAALWRLWESLGVRPHLVAGHSLGEYAALYAAGGLDLADGLYLTAARGHLMRRHCPPGVMAAVQAPRDAVEAATADLPEVELAVINAASQQVLAGPEDGMTEALRRLADAGHVARRLRGDRAFHCSLVEPVLDAFRFHLEQVRLRPLRIPVVGNVGGHLLRAGETPDPTHLLRHTRETADFAAVLARLDEEGTALCVEAGPDATLTALARRAKTAALWIPSQPGREPGPAGLLRAVAELHRHGLTPRWEGLVAPGAPGRHVPLPTHPFDRRSYWISAGAATPPAGGHPMTDDSAPAPAAGTAPVDQLGAELTRRVRELTAEQLSLTHDEVHPDAAFFDLGADSLLLINMLRRLEKTFGVRIPMRQLFEESDTPARLGAVLADRISPERAQEITGARPAATAPAPAAEGGGAATGSPGEAAVSAPAAVPVSAHPAPAAPVPPPPAPEAAAAPEPAAPEATTPQAPSGAATTEAGRLVERQLDLIAGFSRLMGDQLAVLRGTPGAGQAAAPAAQGPAPQVSTGEAERAAGPQPDAQGIPEPAPQPQEDRAAPAVSHGPRVTVPRSSGMAAGRLTEAQRAHVDDLTRRLTRRTATSKELTGKYRPVLADSRAVVGFRSATKEMQYPLAARAARGAHLVDVDGNAYVDITMGFGVLLFGHEPDFLNEAVQRYLSGGLRLGPRSEETGRAAELLAGLTGFDRVAFANSGTEANSAALRLARAAVGRDTVVMFRGSYHGHADNVLGQPVVENGRRVTVPASSGIPAGAVEDLVVLDYGAPESLTALEAIADTVAVVMVEPVQSRHPGLQPKEFLQALRRLTRQHGIVLLFDEMLTGFRPHPQGAQGVFGVTPDLATYGKVLGGGYPIGAIAGRADLMDGVDGGQWSYGDDSYPPRDTTFFGGTYIQHPVAMAATEAVLTHLKQAGPRLQEDLNATTEALVGRLNRFFEDEEFPVRIARFGSLFRFEYRGNLELFFHHLLLRGVYVWEWRNFFLSTAHTEEDLEVVEHAVRNALWDMRRGGFLPPQSGPRPVPAYEPPPEVPQIPAPAEPVRKATVEETRPRPAPAGGRPLPAPRRGEPARKAAGAPDFSLYFFGDYPRESADDDKYAIVMDGARFADRNGFHAVWLPERHFHSFGGVFPNPAVLGAALARETSRIRINAGSVVLPLHHPVRVAEEWSVIDNLSGGRVGIGCASGWHANDFVLRPENYGHHKEVMYDHLRTVQRLWRGEEFTAPNGHGDEVPVRLYPRPVQDMPPFYTAIVGNPESYRQAARHDLGVITNLMTQSVADLAQNIALYRNERAAAGLDPASGRVVVLLHSYLGDDTERARDEALPAFTRYMRSSLSLFGQVSNSLGLEIDYQNTPEEDLEFVLERAYARYCESRALIGTPDSAAPVVDSLIEAGVDEIAYFVDFGVTPQQARAGLPHLDRLRRRYQQPEALAATRPDSPGTPPEHRPEGEALSFAQQRLWFLHRMHPGLTAYNECAAVRLEGALDVTALRTALARAVERHPALRSVFREVGDEPRRVVTSTPHDGPELLDLAAEGAAQDGAVDEPQVLDEVVAQECAHVFDLSRGPLLRTRLLRFAPEHHVLLLTAHHLVFDSGSAEVLTADLGELYTAAVQGRPDRLPPPPDDGGHAERERQLLAGPDGRRSLAHWCERLAGAPPHLELPADRPRPPAPTGRGDSAHRRLDARLTAAVRALGRDRRATTFMVLLTAYYATLQRFTGRDDLVVGTPVANRPPGTEELVGFFVNTLALRTDLSGDPSFAEALDRVRDTAFDAYEHQECPFEAVVRELNPDRDPSRAPVVQVFLEYETGPVLEPDLPGVRATSLDLRVRKAPLDLTLFLTDLDDGLRCRAEYSTDLFEAATVERFLDCFEQTLAAAVADADRPLSALAGPTAADRSLLARTEAAPPYTGTHHGTAPGEAVHHRVLRQAAAQPDALAVSRGRDRLTYRELGEHSAGLARTLLDRGCGPGDVVGVSLPRGPELAVALLAVARTGAAYLPLDPDHPGERVAYMLAESDAVALLTDGTALPAAAGVPPITVDLGATDDAGPPQGPPPQAAVGEDDLLCVLYTSGSTGRPKGVGVRHGGMANVTDWHHREFGTAAADRASWISSPAFDACGLELWAHLAAGASLHAVPEKVRAAPEPLRDWLVAERISSAFFTTPLAEQVLDTAWPAGAALRLLVTGGDRLRRWRPEGAPFRLVNIYGPTENTVVSTWTEVPRRDGRAGEPAIGLPVPGTLALVLDRELRTVPVGVTGELYVAGANLAAGYVAQPELTEERFVKDPHGRVPGRLYRTGDLVRRRNDGLLEFVGRADRQVKIRGHRVEPQETEHVLTGLPGVREAAVVARPDRDGAPHLVAYAVLDEGVPDGAAEQAARSRLVQEAGGLLPDYLVPRAWVFLPSLPADSSGKVDRRHLPLPDLGSDAADAPPATELEKRLHDLWAAELGLERVSVERSFFDLGGHSLNAVRLLNRVRARTGAEVSVLDFFRAPTIRGTARLLEQDAHAPTAAEDTPGRPAPGGAARRSTSEDGTGRVRGTI